MKFLDKVKVINDRKEYEEKNVFKNMIGTIIDAEIRDNYFHVVFVDSKITDNIFKLQDDILCAIRIEDLELIEDRKCPDDKILDALPKNDKNWWCKVENGYILNLKGEKKNKKPYEY